MEIAVIRRPGLFLIDLGLSQSHPTVVSGRLLLRQVEATNKGIQEGAVITPRNALLPGVRLNDVPGIPSSWCGNCRPAGPFSNQMEPPFSESIMDFSGFFDGEVHGMSYDFAFPEDFGLQ